MKYSDRIQVLVQIVSITDIPKDVIPYLAIKMGGKVLHRTEYASSETGSDIYTLEEGCFFLLNMPLLEFFCSTGGMTFLVKDQDRVAVKGKAIGRAIVPIERMVNAKGERDIYKIIPVKAPEDQVDDVRGKLCIRMRRAIADDIDFMTSYRVASNKEGFFFRRRPFFPTCTLTYPLYFGKSSQHRQNNRGTITVRFRVVLDNSRKAIIVGMKPQKPTFISVATEDDFAIAHYTTEGVLYELRE